MPYQIQNFLEETIGGSNGGSLVHYSKLGTVVVTGGLLEITYSGIVTCLYICITEDDKSDAGNFQFNPGVLPR